MSMQIIKDRQGHVEYVLLPAPVYEALKDEIEDELAGLEAWANREDDYLAFNPADYVTNQVAVMRMQAGAKQRELARAMGVSQPYLSKLEHAETVTPEAFEKARAALNAINADT